MTTPPQEHLLIESTQNQHFQLLFIVLTLRRDDDNKVEVQQNRLSIHAG